MFCLTGIRGELQAAGADLRLGDGLQESGVLSGGELGWQLANVARNQVGLLIPDQKGDVRLQHIDAHLLLSERKRDKQVSGRLHEQSFKKYIFIFNIYLQRQTQRAEKQHEVRHETQQVGWEGLRGCQPISKLIQQT